MTLEACKEMCLRNCSCTAYTNLDIREGGLGCLLWFDNLIDMRKLSDGEQDLYIRMAATELGAFSFHFLFLQQILMVS